MNAISMITTCLERQTAHLVWLTENMCECGERILRSRWRCVTCELKAHIQFVQRTWPSRG